MFTLALMVVLAFVVCLVLAPQSAALARRIGAVDRAGDEGRRVHASDTPRLGGIAIVAGTFLPLMAAAVLDTGLWRAATRESSVVLGLFLGATCMVALGLYDDLNGARPRLKLLVQLGAALLAVRMGFTIDALDLPFFRPFQLGALSIPLTLLWIIGITNAVNLIDGLDGLASGVALIALLPVLVLGVANHHTLLVLFGGAMVGSLLGFLVYNWHPAKIFMGDSGSMFLGFSLALLTVEGSKASAAVSLLTAMLALGVPILDTLLSIVRRTWLGSHPFAADKGHLHHRLLARGLTQRGVVVVLYAVSALFAGLGVALHFNRDLRAAFILVGALLVAAVLLRAVGYLRVPTEGFGPGLQHAAARRRRAQELRQRAKGLAARVAEGLDHEQIVGEVGELLRISGALWGRLEYKDPATREQRVAEWSFDGVCDGPGEHRLLLRPAVTSAPVGVVKVAFGLAADELSQQLGTLDEGLSAAARILQEGDEADPVTDLANERH